MHICLALFSEQGKELSVCFYNDSIFFSTVMVYSIINSDLFNVEWLAMVEPWFTWRLWPEGDVRLQVNLASDWGWGRNIRITSQAIFCVLDMNNFYRRNRKVTS